MDFDRRNFTFELDQQMYSKFTEKARPLKVTGVGDIGTVLVCLFTVSLFVDVYAYMGDTCTYVFV